MTVLFVDNASLAVVPAQAGTHSHRAFDSHRACHVATTQSMGPRLRGDDSNIGFYPLSVTRYTTTFTIRCGTTITLRGALPSSARCTASSASTAASITALVASR